MQTREGAPEAERRWGTIGAMAEVEDGRDVEMAFSQTQEALEGNP